jgi:signal recognition particle subunit SRP54
MGDVLSLVEEVQAKVDRDKAEQLVTKLKQGKDFDLADFKEQMEQMNKLGGMASLMDKLPGMGSIPDEVKGQLGDKEVKRLIAMINSMTPHERAFPAIIKGSHKKRIAAGSGTQVQDVNRLLRQFMQMQKMMKKMRGGNIRRMLSGLKGRLPGSGGFPPPGRRPF